MREIISTSNDPEEIGMLLAAIEQCETVSRSTIVKCRKAAEGRLSELRMPVG